MINVERIKQLCQVVVKDNWLNVTYSNDFLAVLAEMHTWTIEELTDAFAQTFGISDPQEVALSPGAKLLIDRLTGDNVEDLRKKMGIFYRFREMIADHPVSNIYLEGIDPRLLDFHSPDYGKIDLGGDF